jgi:steroid delta-isomerase-like uncharacterized protein
MSQQNKDLVLAYVEAFNRADLDALCNLFTADALIWGVYGWGDLKTVRPLWKELMACLNPNLQVEAIIAEADSVAARYIERGTAVSAFRGKQATGRSYELTAMEWFVIKDGLIHRRWGARDSATLAKQLGWDT